MLELIHMTAQYSNAVLVALLPCITDFATKLDLPIEQPVRGGHVMRVAISPYKDYIEGGVWLTNHWWFEVGQRGFVQAFRAPTNWFFEQEFTDESVKQYFGQDHMTTNEVVSMARDALLKLGYEPELTHSYEEPTLRGPCDLKRVVAHIPYCEVNWEWPKMDHSIDANLNHIQIVINMESKTLVGMTVIFSRTNRALLGSPLKVAVVPELQSDYVKRVKGKMFISTNAPPRFPGKPLDTD